MSRQINQLVEAELLKRAEEQPGRRGHQLKLTFSGRQALASAAESVRTLLIRELKDWTDADIAIFASLINRFNEMQA